MEYRLLMNIIDNLEDIIYVLDKDGNVLYINNKAVSVFGYSKKELLSLNTYKMLEQGIICVHILPIVLETKQDFTVRQTFVDKHGKKKDLLVTQRPILDAKTNVIYNIGIMREISSLNKTYEYADDKRGSNVYIQGKKSNFCDGYIYKSECMRKLVKTARHVANSDATILILGESGTGKEVLTNYIHNISPRANKELITINCTAIPENLLEAELFGYEKGAFTGALTEGKLGLIEMADQGTLFLDEIDSMPMSIQSKLLRVIETHEVRRLGGIKSKIVNFRLITATNADLKERMEQKLFRPDLYFRLSVVPLTIPPLRDRKEEIKPMCEFFLKHYEKKYERKKEFLPNVYEKLYKHSWPGNVRELKNFVERMVLITDSSIVQIDDISENLIQNANGENLQNTLSNIERNFIQSEDRTLLLTYDKNKSFKENVQYYERWLVEKAVADCGSFSKAAKQLKIDKSTLVRKRKY